MIATILSRILGLVREMTIAHIYGATGNTDAFYLAFNIPELIRTLIISGVLSTIFIPIFADFRENKSFEFAKRVTTEIFSFTALIAVCTVVLGIVFAPAVIRGAEIISFRKIDPDTMRTAIELTRLLFPMLIFIGLSGLIQGILNSLHDYKTPAFAPLIFNIAVISTLIYCKVTNPDFDNIRVLAIVVVAGVFLQYLVQLPALKSHGFILFKIPDFTHEAFVKFKDLAPAAMLGYATMVINSFVDKAIAFGLVEGGITTLYLGFRVQQLPYSIFGVTIVTVLFPLMAQHIAAKRFNDLKNAIDMGVRMLAFTIIPSSVFFMAMSTTVIRVLFSHGEFQNFAQGVEWTADALKYYTFGIFPAVSLLLISRVFFSFQDTKTPLKAGAIMIVVNFCLDQLLASHFGIKGIAFATSIVSFLNCMILLYFLKSRLPDIWKSFFNRNILKMLIVGLVQYAALVFMLMQYNSMYPEHTAVQDIIAIAAGLLVSIIVFGGFSYVFKCGEWKMIFEYVFSKRRRDKEIRLDDTDI
jgi:putative peptidoglycan lipid II flippase